MVNNLKIIKPLLNFTSEDDYYFLQVIVRKKDRDSLPFKLGGSNNNSRLIKAYYVSSIEYLENRYEEIKALCDLFHARAMICLNKRSYYSSSHQMMVQLAQSIQSKNYRNSAMWNNVSGKYHPVKDKTWILDIDEDEDNADFLYNLEMYILNQQPNEGESKTIIGIPSKTGRHIITKPFDLQGFREEFPTLDIHKNNPTNLYIP